MPEGVVALKKQDRSPVSRVLFYAWIATAMLLSWTVIIPTGFFRINGQWLGGTIELGVPELIVAALLAIWILRLGFSWVINRREPRLLLPLFGVYFLIVLAHALSAFSPAHPFVLGVLKYTIRPVFWVYLTSVIIPVNFIRTRKHLMIVLGILMVVGLFFAFDGLRSLAYGSDDQTLLARAHPMLIFGRYWIGDNHNVLAELLAFTAPVALAFATLVRRVQLRRWLFVAAGFMTFIALVTFARSAWIALAIEVLFLCATVWRPWIKRNRGWIVLVMVGLAPLVAYFLFFASQAGVQSSTDSRVMLADIAYNLFRGSPVFGVGAGTFVDRVAQVWLFKFEYGPPLDSHGILQKLLAETGILGIVVFGYYLARLGRYFVSRFHGWKENQQGEKNAALYLISAVLGAFVYQLFNTTYWTPKLWLPVGITIAALYTLRSSVVPAVNSKKNPDV